MKPYDDLCANADGFFETVLSRRRDDMLCASGCDGCCQVQLSVCAVEADAVRRALGSLDAKTKSALRLKADALAESGATSDPAPPCVMLDADGRCAVYEGRPLVCRTHGLPLMYADAPDVPVDALTASAERLLVWCDLNFTKRPPERADVLDGDRLNGALALVNRAFAESATEGSADAPARFSLVALVQNVC